MKKEKTKRRVKNTISLTIFLCSLVVLSIASITLYSTYQYNLRLQEEKEKIQKELDEMEKTDHNQYEEESGSSHGDEIIIEFPN